MRKILLSFFIVFSVSCTAQTSVRDNFKKIQWLVGEWNRTNQKPGRSGMEKWVKNSETELQGWGFIMKGADTAFVEKLKMIVKDNNIYYVADVPENKGVVLFKLTKITDDEFVCENPEHDFPKVIAYKKEDGKLKATISGNGKSIDYLFERKL